jgi:hypothetical protein
MKPKKEDLDFLRQDEGIYGRTDYIPVFISYDYLLRVCNFVNLKNTDRNPNF